MLWSGFPWFSLAKARYKDGLDSSAVACKLAKEKREAQFFLHMPCKKAAENQAAGARPRGGVLEHAPWQRKTEILCETR